MGGVGVRQGRAGGARAPGPAARRVALLLGGGAVVVALLSAERFWHDRDLHDLSGLQRGTAVVEDLDERRRWVDHLQVRFDAAGRRVEASIPWSGSVPAPAPGGTVEVAFRPQDPSRVRTVQGWAPAFEFWLVQAVTLAIIGMLVGGFGVWSRWSGRYEPGAPVPAPAAEQLGVRVVRGSLAAQAVLVGLGLLASVPLFYSGVVRQADRRNLLGGVVVVLLATGVAAGMHLWWGRDGVWTTPNGLVARRRGRLQRWPWGQVLELGVVVGRGRATVAAARLDDGGQDRIGVDGWVTLARPLSGPLVAYRWKVNLQQLAQQRGLPFTDGLSSSDLADSLSGNYLHRRSAAG